ncbi:MAG: hypothetical protein GY822_27625 [Deltaproteobacteria bacterium]|nr:hypothetical protein [Deltaproteobacteria bacterium]
MQNTAPSSPVDFASTEQPAQNPDRRRSDRAPLNLLVQFRFKNQDAFAKEFSKNLSSSGMFLETDSPRSEGGFLYFQFQVGHESHYIEGLGKVVRVCDGKGEGVKGMGIQFINVDDESQTHIDDIVNKRLNKASH